MRNKNRAKKAKTKGKTTALPQDALDWQERHSPTTRDWVRMKGAKASTDVRRRSSDAKLMANLTRRQQNAMVEIGAMVAHVASGLGAKSQQYERKAKGQGDGGGISIPIEDWMDWGRILRRDGIDNGVWASVIVDGRSLSAVDHARGWREGKAKIQLCLALDAWATARGWDKAGGSAPEEREYAYRAPDAHDGGDRSYEPVDCAMAAP